MSTKRQKWTCALKLAILVMILSGATWVRFAHLRTSPGWYADEGSDIDIATHLMQGKMQYFAVVDSALIAARPPLFHLLLAGLFSLFGRDILILRALTAFYGVASVLLLFVLGRRIWGSDIALLASALYAVYPGAVANARFGFLYNQTTVLYILLFFSLWRFRATRSQVWMAVACLSAGLCLVTGVNSLPVVGFVVIVLLLTRPAVLSWALPLIGLPLFLYSAWMGTAAPDAFVYDLQFILGRVGGNPFTTVLFAVWNFMQLLREDAWFLLGALGLTRLPASSGRLYTNLFFWYVLFTTVAGVPNITGLAYHHAISLMPWAAVGVSSFLFWATPRLVHELEVLIDRLYRHLPDGQWSPRWRAAYRRGLPRFLVDASAPGKRAEAHITNGLSDKLTGFVQRQGRLWTVGLGLFWMLIAPFVVIAVELAYQIEHGITPVSVEVEQVTVNSRDEAEAAVSYVNENAGPEDLVIAPPHVAWMVTARVTDFQQVTAYAGGRTQNYPESMPRERFLFDCSVDKAHYAIFWSDWREWAGSVMPDVDATFRVVETWPVVFERGSWRVYRNPSAQSLP